MIPSPIPSFEADRQSAVDRLGILQKNNWSDLDVLVKEAADRFDLPMSTVTIIDKDTAHFIAKYGVNISSTPRELSFCGHAMIATETLVVEDTLTDGRFSDNPLVTNAPFLRFYAGAAIHDRATNLPIGVFCVRGIAPRKFPTSDIVSLLEYAERAEEILNQNA
jgi:GAF domain-containing protein